MTKGRLNVHDTLESEHDGRVVIRQATQLLRKLPRQQAVQYALEFRDLLSDGIQVRLVHGGDSVLVTEDGVQSQVVLPEAFVERVLALAVESEAVELDFDSDLELSASHQGLQSSGAN